MSISPQSVIIGRRANDPHALANFADNAIVKDEGKGIKGVPPFGSG